MIVIPALDPTLARRALWLPAAALLSVVGAPGAVAYDITDRWTVTQTDGAGIQRGDAITVTWSFVPDGENWSRGINSDLIDFLDDGWFIDEEDRTPDLTNRIWWDLANQAYEQYTDVSGLTLIYVPEQNPDGTDSGQFGDIRIGGGYIDGPAGIIANNTFPNYADMKVDTGRNNQGDPVGVNNAAGWRNVIAHESGHGMGLSHTEVTGADALMEAGLQTSFFGLQFDDVYAINRLYGDPREKDGGNDSFNTATDLGQLALGESVSLGTDANDSEVEQFDDDWLGVDGDTDIDYFRFSLAQPTTIDLVMTPQGPTYTTQEQGPDTDFSAQADLNLTLFNAGQAQVAFSDAGDAGDAESFTGLELPAGEYFLAVDGEADLNQFYRLDLTVAADLLSGDLDQDGDIDGVDLGVAFFNFTGPGGSGKTAEQGDLDGDGDVDGVDLGIHFSSFTGPSAAPGPASVPEPAGAALLLAAAGLFRSRRG